MTTRGSQIIKYDPERRPVRVDVGGTICRFACDGDGIRRKRLDDNGTIRYVGSYYERPSNGRIGNGLETAEVVTKYYLATFGPSAGRMSWVIAFRRAGTLYWVGTDHPGSTIRVADGGFSAVDGMRYRPYGGSRDVGSNLKTDHKFTGQIEDGSVGLCWDNSRAYDASLSRKAGLMTVSNGESVRYRQLAPMPGRTKSSVGV